MNNSPDQLLSPEQQKKLTENERRLREAERLAKMGSWELNLVTNTLVWSDEIYRIFDTTPQSFGATYEAFLSYIHPEDREMIHLAYINSVANKEPYGPITHRLIMTDGSIKFVEERGNTEYDDEGTPIRSIGIVQDITERVLGEHTKAQLKEKEVLLKEIYHRVKNNLQLVSSIINIQVSQIEDKSIQKIFKTCQDRISSIALIHEQLCNSDNLATIKISDYINKLINNIKAASGNLSNISFEISVCENNMSMDKAIPCGLILNEIISNSVKHAFKDKAGTVSIDIKQENEKWVFKIADNGIGVANIDDLLNSNSFGLDIIKSLVEQLDGEMIIDSQINQGIVYHISFP